NRLTDNILLLRYQGETAGTLRGTREKDLSQITSGRYDIFLSDLQIWTDNFILGVGPGESPNMREGASQFKLLAHVEMSRLLSEHGLFGFIISLTLFILPVVQFIRCRQ